MSYINVRNEIETYNQSFDTDGEKPLVVESVWPRCGTFVLLNIGGKKVTVEASALKRAVDNCTNQSL